LQNFIHNIVFFDKKTQFFAENWQKIAENSVIITSTPGRTDCRPVRLIFLSRRIKRGDCYSQPTFLTNGFFGHESKEGVNSQKG
jgi:hypothetical protein